MNRKGKWLLKSLAFVLCVGAAATLWFAATVLLPSYKLDNLVDDLRAEGAEVQVPSELPYDGHWFPVAQQAVVVNGETVLVYQFPDNLQALRAALAVEPHGNGILPLGGTTGVMIDWVLPPHWYRRGQLIVQHVGRDSIIDKMLEKHLGRQFAGFQSGYPRAGRNRAEDERAGVDD